MPSLLVMGQPRWLSQSEETFGISSRTNTNGTFSKGNSSGARYKVTPCTLEFLRIDCEGYLECYTNNKSIFIQVLLLYHLLVQYTKEHDLLYNLQSQGSKNKGNSKRSNNKKGTKSKASNRKTAKKINGPSTELCDLSQRLYITMEKHREVVIVVMLLYIQLLYVGPTWGGKCLNTVGTCSWSCNCTDCILYLLVTFF
jgi:hypothetical protein